MSVQAISGPQAFQVQVPGSAVMAGTAAEHKLARLTDAAQRFEGMMMQEMLKPLQNSQSEGMWGGEDDPDRDSSLDTMSSYGTEAMANALAKQGGMGVAKQVVAQVTRLDERTHGHGGGGQAASGGSAGVHSGGRIGIPMGPPTAIPMGVPVATGSGDAGQHVLGSARASFGRTGVALSEKEPKGTPQVLKFGNTPPMR